MTVRQVAVDFPESREVFRGYGEPDNRPGYFGHYEPLTHFARRRNLPLDQLLDELAEATGAPIDVRSRYAERVHRPFLLAAMAITLLFGAGWGAWLLLQIGVSGDFDAVPAGQIIAHGEAQLWGFVGLFIIGISLRTALQAVPRHPLGRWACHGLLAAALVGIGGGWLWFLFPSSLSALGVMSGSALLLLAASFWVLQLIVLCRKRSATWARAIMIAGFWLAAWAATTLVLRATAGPEGPGVYSGPQRLLIIELAVFGFAINSIYGFGQLLLPGFLRTGTPHRGALELALWLHNLGTLLLCLATVWVPLASLAAAGSALVAAGGLCYWIGQKAFLGKVRQSRRLEKGHPLADLYVPLAFFWLLASLVMLATGHFYQVVTGEPLPHEFVGAVRHALTVGFMTTLILGVGQRLLPVLEHRVLPRPALVVPILLLIATGNLLRVGSELAVLFTPAAFPVMPLSAVLEWAALLLFGISVVATMRETDPLLARGRVGPRSSLADLLAEQPWIEDRLIHAGVGYLGRVRCVPRELTISTFAEREGLRAEQLVAEINAMLGEASPGEKAH